MKSNNKPLTPVMVEKLTAQGVEIDPSLSVGEVMVAQMDRNDPSKEVTRFKIKQKGFDRYYASNPLFQIKKKAK